MIGKISYPPEKFYQNKIFNFPKTINYTNVKTLTIDQNFPINLADIKVFQNLVELHEDSIRLTRPKGIFVGRMGIIVKKILNIGYGG